MDSLSILESYKEHLFQLKGSGGPYRTQSVRRRPSSVNRQPSPKSYIYEKTLPYENKYVLWSV